MRLSLIMSADPSYSTPFYADPWPMNNNSKPNPLSPSAQEEAPSPSSSRTSSSCSHVLPESAFYGKEAPEGSPLVDPYFGNEDAARLCASYLIKTFKCQEETPYAKRLGQPTLSVFIAQLIYLTGIPFNLVVATLILLQRFEATLPANSGGYSGHRLFLGALILACNDEGVHGTVKNARSAGYWSDISLFSEQEVDDMYNHLYDELDGNVAVFPSYGAALEKLSNPLVIKTFLGDQDLASCDSDSDSDIDMAPSSLSAPSSKKVKTHHPHVRSLRSKITSLFRLRD